MAKIKWRRPYCREALHGKYWVACSLNPYQIPLAGQGIRALDANLEMGRISIGWYVWLGFEPRTKYSAVGRVIE